MIRMTDLHVTFNRGTAMEKKALRGGTLDIKKGDFVCVIGGNGAGKTTLLNALCGDVFPEKGKISIDNKDVTNLSTWQRAPYVARVFQDPMAGTCANLTIEENLALAMGRGAKRTFKMALNKEHRDKFRAQLSRLKLGLENRLQDPIGMLSGGQRQAVSLVMAVLRPMKIIALDEHTAALDPKTAAFILELTHEIVEEHYLTTLMVTHSMHQALELGNRTLMLHEGRVVFDVEGEKRRGLKVSDLLDLFHQASGLELDDDSLLLS
ncbi:MAG: ABC transporter ATP-binding protein [Alphaproteobacteria bacterium RBG_16_42_14]|nr:MAG: ABC transporter ATP-binding protein [Alphaproteobacteria bacterium RBG_16_42_14]